MEARRHAATGLDRALVTGPQMDTVSADLEGKIEVVIDDEERLGAPGHTGERGGARSASLPGGVGLVAILKRGYPRIEGLLDRSIDCGVCATKEVGDQVDMEVVDECHVGAERWPR